MSNYFFKNKKGFTLVELMVALGLFSIVMAITTGGFIRFLKSEKQSSSFTFVNDSLSVVLEQMAKEIRTGKTFSTDASACPPSGGFSSVNSAGQTVNYVTSGALSFINSKNQNVTYYLESGIVKRSVGTGGAGNDCSSGQAITGNKVSVGYLTFLILNNQVNSPAPPRITILIGANPNNEFASIYTVNLQTTVSSRHLGG